MHLKLSFLNAIAGTMLTLIPAFTNQTQAQDVQLVDLERQGFSPSSAVNGPILSPLEFSELARNASPLDLALLSEGIRLGLADSPLSTPTSPANGGFSFAAAVPTTPRSDMLGDG